MESDLYALTIMTLAAVAGALTAAVVTLITSRKKKNEEKKYVTVVKCPSCGYEEERDWREGDFVGMIDSPCPKCGAVRVVWSIYAKDESKEEGESPL